MMTDNPFSLEPTSQADMDDLAARGIEWIKERLEQAAMHIPNVYGIKALAEDQELSAEDSYALLAYRVLVDLVRLSTTAARSAQTSVGQHIVDVPKIILPH